MRDSESAFPYWIGGLLLGLLLIILSTQGRGVNTEALQREFAPDPNAPTPAPFQLPIISLPELPAGMQQTLNNLRDRFTAGQPIPALTPIAATPRVRVEVQTVTRSGEQVSIKGSITNISDAPLNIGLNAFSFRDSFGVSYAASGASTTLAPGQSTTLELALPLPKDRGLTLIFNLPPDPPVEQILMLETRP
jgi:hypothetical protein